MSRARDNADLGDSYGSLAVGVTGGSGLNALSASNLSAGTVADARMPNLTGDVTTVEGAVATTIATDAVDIAMLSATGTASDGTFLRGDNTWAAAGSPAIFFSGKGFESTTTNFYVYKFPETRLDRDEGGAADNFDASTGLYEVPKTGYYLLDFTFEGNPSSDTNSGYGGRVYHGSTNILQSAAIGYGYSVQTTTSSNLVGVKLATAGETFSARSYIEGTGGALVGVQFFTIVYLGA